jgi:putative transcriptional regulator
MTAKRIAKSDILEAFHETAEDLHELGFIDKRRMQKYQAFCM